MQSSQQTLSESRAQEKSNLTYTAEKIIGSGTFGVVYRAICTETGEQVAIKKVFQDKKYKNRELQIIRELKHPNIVSLVTSFLTNGRVFLKVDEVYLNLVMEFMPDTLSRLIKSLYKQKKQIPEQQAKLYAYQMFRALVYLTSCGICHRDIKPQNMLIDPELYILKLCDFGSAKRLIKGEPNISYICSRYYRAPELIFGATEYTPDIDTWSVGCVFAEILMGKPLFPGESAVDQLVEIIKILGTPTFEQVQAMNPDYKDFKFPNIKPFQLNKLFKSKVDPLAIELLSKILVYSPRERIQPIEALLHAYFDEIRSESFSSTLDKHTFSALFEFSEEERKFYGTKLDSLVPEWYRKSNNK